MKTREDFPDNTKYARYLMEVHKTPKYLKLSSVVKRIKDGETDIKKILSPPMTRSEQGKKGRKASELNPFLSQKQKIRT